MEDRAFESGGTGSPRLQPLARPQTPRRGRTAGVLALAILALGAVSMSAGLQRQPIAEPRVYLPAGGLQVVANHPADDGPLSVHSYDVTDVLIRMDELRPTEPAEQSLLAACLAILPGTVQLENGTLTAKLNEKSHERLQQMLAAWRVGGHRQILIELRVIQADLSLASSIDWLQAKVNNLQQRGSLPVVAAHISDDQLRQFVQDVSADSHSNILQAPKMTLFNGQTATIIDRVQRPLVTAVEPQDGGWLQPVIEVLDEGMTMTLRAVTTGDGTVELMFDLQTSRIDAVAVANLPYPHPEGPDGKVTVQVPTVLTTSAAATVQLPATQSLLIAAPQPFNSSEDDATPAAIFYALTPRLIEAFEVAPAVDQVATRALPQLNDYSH